MDNTLMVFNQPLEGIQIIKRYKDAQDKCVNFHK